MGIGSEIVIEKESIRDRASASLSVRIERGVGRRIESFENGGGILLIRDTATGLLYTSRGQRE